MRRVQTDNPLLAQPREASTDGLGRQPQMIADIVSAHRQKQLVLAGTAPSGAGRQQQKKRGQFLARRLTTQQHHLVLRRRQLVRRNAENALLQHRVLYEQVLKLLARELTKAKPGHGFAGISVGHVLR